MGEGAGVEVGTGEKKPGAGQITNRLLNPGFSFNFK